MIIELKARIMKTYYFKHNATLLGIVCLFLITACGCAKESLQDQLPPITQTGANTFGCIVDGKIFIPRDSYSSTPGNNFFKGLKLLIGNNFLNTSGDDIWVLSAGNFKIDPNIYIYIYIPSLINANNSFMINTSDGYKDSSLPHTHIYCQIDGSNNTYLSSESSGFIKFSRLDTTSGIYSGTFNVKLKNKDNENDTIEITDGRFDINLNTLNN